MVKMTIYGQPRTKKNSQQIAFNRATGRRFVKQSEAYVAYERDALKQIQYSGEPINVPVNVACTYYRADKRRCDLVNLLECTLDILVKAGVIADDNYNIVARHDNCRVAFDKDEPRTEITITEIAGEDT